MNYACEALDAPRSGNTKLKRTVMNTKIHTNQDLTDNDDVDTSQSGRTSAKDKEKFFQEVIDIITAHILLSINKMGICHVTRTADFETVPLESARLAVMLKRIVREYMGVRLSKPMIADIIDELREMAESPTIERHEVNHRVARGTKGQVFIDIGNANKDVIEVDKIGYRRHDFSDEAPLYLRSRGTMPLPDPVGVAPDLNALRQFINIRSACDWLLLITFILFSLIPGGPYVILTISGTAGSGKSNFSRVLRRLIDPSSVPTQSLPRAVSDLMITATNCHLLVFDNVREITVEISDTLCQIATGGGMRKRALFTNTEETLIHVTKPCILNGIDDIASQPDLVSRCISLDLPTIEVRRTEEEFNRSFEENIGPIFAGLLDLLSKTLAELPNVTDTPDARMADFARFGTAVQHALDLPEGSFKDAYAQNQREQMTNSLGDDPLAQAIRALVRLDIEDGVAYTKTPTAMLKALDEFATQAQVVSKVWPQSPNSLSKRLKKMEPALRACGVGIAFHHSGNRTISLTRLECFKK